MQEDFFSSQQDELFNLGDGAYLHYFPQWLKEPEAGVLYKQLKESLQWEQPQIHIAGRMVPTPRLQCWCSEQSLIYSGQTFAPLPWPQNLKNLCERIERVDGADYNSVLINYYRNGQDSVSWHADDEPELGHNPTIASISLGATRRFLLKPKKNSYKESRLTIELNSGDLLIMSGSCQSNWLHAIPKTKRLVEGRINLTFRQMLS